MGVSVVTGTLLSCLAKTGYDVQQVYLDGSPLLKQLDAVMDVMSAANDHC